MKKLVVLFALAAVAWLSVSPAFSEDPPPFILKWGSYGTGNGQFYQPLAVAVDPFGNVFVMDTYNYRIQKFTSEGGFLLKWGERGTGQGQYMLLADIAVDLIGNVYVLDRERNVVEKYTNNGNFITSWYVPWMSVSLTVDALGTVLVLRYGYPQVLRYTSDGQLIDQWGWTFPQTAVYDIVTDRERNVYVLLWWVSYPSWADRVLKFTPDGTFITSIDKYGNGSPPYWYNAMLAIDGEDNLYLPNIVCSVEKRSNAGQLISQWGSCGSDNGQFNDPRGVAVDHHGNIYVVDKNNHRIQKFGPGGSSGPGGLPAVVLVHGLCSDAGDWTDLAMRLVGKGFSVYSDLNLTPNDARPGDLVGDLDQYLNSLPLSGKAAVVAHSMGGLVAREYIRRNPARNRISTLITLGTPHHGSDIASVVTRSAFARGLTTRANPFGCQPHAPALWDLITGSSFLNDLNYSGETLDEFGKTSNGTHQAEAVHDPSVKIVTFAGTHPVCFPTNYAFSDAWATTWFGRKYGIAEYLNDGVVGINAARMYNLQATNYIDAELSLPSLTHSGSLAYFFCFDQSYLNSSGLADIIANILKGGAPVGGSASQSMLATASTSNDTLVVELEAPSGTLGTGSVAEYTLNVPGTPYLQVLLTADSAKLFLRSPTDTLITPEDTLTTPGLRFVKNSDLGLEGFLVDAPQSGTWTVRVDGSASLQPQEYATAISVASTKSVEVKAAPTAVSPGDSVVVLASIRELGSAIPGTTWNCIITRPDSANFPLALYDDGAHGDSLANDGVFGAYVHPPDQPGFYPVTVSGTTGSLTLVSGTAFELQHVNDLAMVGDVSVNRNLIVAGDSAMVSATVQNLGVDPASNVKVEFWDNQTKFAVDSLGLAAGASQTMTALWVASLPDTHVITVVVSPFTLPLEASYTNNSVNKTIVLGEFVTGVDPTIPGRLWFGPAQPNPSFGTVEFRFVTPSRGPARCTIYDVQGRLIKRWQWEDLPAGQHTLQWNGRTDHGQTAPAGMLFVRLVMNGRTATNKLVRLR